MPAGFLCRQHASPRSPTLPSGAPSFARGVTRNKGACHKPQHVTSRCRPDAISAGGPTVEEVKQILEQEHETHCQGRVMVTGLMGQGRMMMAGYGLHHVKNLTPGGPQRSVDFGYYS